QAAVLGEVFWTGAVLVLTRLRHENEDGSASPGHDRLRDRIESLLGELADRDYLVSASESSLPGEKQYEFRHRLERELVAKMTDPARAERYAAFAAEWLETRVGERSEAELELLAGLHERAGQKRRAAFHPH